MHVRADMNTEGADRRELPHIGEYPRHWRSPTSDRD
jgi:hypothetical protein